MYTHTRTHTHTHEQTHTAGTMEIVEMVLGGRVNKSLVSLIEQNGGHAIGLSGKDGGLLKARQVRVRGVADVCVCVRVSQSSL
jgi:acetylglutamate kinase